jgi:hypothetical protein
MEYKQAVVKFNNGKGALLCNRCRTILATGFEHEDREHFCVRCGVIKEMMKKHKLGTHGEKEEQP